MQGLFALSLRSSFMLGLHVVLGAMLSAAIAAYDASVFDNQDFRSALFYVATAGPCNSYCAGLHTHAADHHQQGSFKLAS